MVLGKPELRGLTKQGPQAFVKRMWSLVKGGLGKVGIQAYCRSSLTGVLLDGNAWISL
jgi:predicted thioredoxin/glutaredoxin